MLKRTMRWFSSMVMMASVAVLMMASRRAWLWRNASSVCLCSVISRIVPTMNRSPVAGTQYKDFVVEMVYNRPR